MKSRYLCFFVFLLNGWAGSDPVAAQLASRARKAMDAGQTVRAYLLFGEAAARDPHNPTYRSNRDALASAAQLLTKADVQNPNIIDDVRAAEEEAANPEPPIQLASESDWNSLQPVQHVQVDAAKHDFDLHADAKSLFQQVTSAYGIRAIWDVDVQSDKPIKFEVKDADFRTALEAVTAATHTFVFPVSAKLVYFAPDTEPKRNELEPVVMLTFPLQDALNEKDLIEAANAVRGVLNLRTIGWDSVSRVVMIRDRETKAQVARSLLEALLLPQGQLSLELQFLTLDTDRNFHYGISPQTVFQVIDFGRIGGFQSILPATVNATSFGPFGGGATLFGVGLTEATAFASYTNSVAQTIYDATVVVADRQIVNFHVGDKYPIAQSIYTGAGQGAGSIYNPAPQITLEDLGLVLKITPHINGEGAIDLEVEAEYKTLGSETFNTIPEIGDRSFKGNVSLREGQWAILAGLNAKTHSVTRDGLAGLASIPGLSHILSENTRDAQVSDTLVLIKPTITRLPMTSLISPQYLLGPQRGERVLL